MHRTNRVPYVAYASFVLAMILGDPAWLKAQAQVAPPPSAQPNSVLIIPIGSVKKFQMSGKPAPAIAKVENENENLIRVQPIPGDPTTVQIIGLEAGITRLTFVDRNGKIEKIDVVVQTDIEYLRSMIKRTAPTANVDPIPGANNTIILTGTVSRIDDIEKIMGAARAMGGAQVIDGMRVGGVQQIELCVTVASISRSQFRAMAFNFLGNSKNTFYGSTVGQAVANPAIAGVTSSTFSIAPLLGGVPGTPNGSPTNLFFGVLHNGWGLLTFLQALKEEDVVKALAEPKLVTLSGKPASFISGGEQAVPIPAGLGQVGVQFEEFGTRLNFLPIVLGGGRIRLEVEPEISALNPAFGTTIQGTVVPGRSTQRVHTTVELEDGQTFVIGGLIQHDVRASISKVPVLGDLPFLGAAFSSKSFNDVEQELVILVTPHLVDGQACNQVVKTLPGQETRNPDDFELFLEGILEAPRGQRDIEFPCGYAPAYKSGPTASQFPCGVDGGGNGRCNSCGKGGCATGVGPGMTPVALPAPVSGMAITSPATAGSQPLPSLTPAPAEDGKTVPADATIPPPPPAGTSKPTILPPGLSETENENGPPKQQ